MKDKDYKRDWAQEQARAKLRAMRGSGMSDVAIGKLVGGSEPITGVFIGDGFIDKLCTAFGFRFIPSNDVAQSTNADTITVPRELWDELLQQGKTNARLLNAVLDQLDKLKAPQKR